MLKKIVCIVFITFTCNPFAVFSQDSIPISLNKTEEKGLAFQEHFFKALAQKAIFNYRIAIQELEKCNELKVNDVSVLFELSKNYFHINKYIESIAYGKQALKVTPDNVWLLEHLVKVYIKEKNFNEAIKIQEKLTERNPKNGEQLVYFYFQNRQYDEAKLAIQELKSKGLMNQNLTRLNQRFVKVTPTKKDINNESLSELILSFEKNKTFKYLHKILTLTAESNNQLLLKYSTLGADLFPAQPIVYLMKGKALNKSKAFDKAIDSLQNGIDFVIDNRELEAQFYEQLEISYRGLGNAKEAIKSKKRALELRKK